MDGHATSWLPPVCSASVAALLTQRGGSEVAALLMQRLPIGPIRIIRPIRLIGPIGDRRGRDLR